MEVKGGADKLQSNPPAMTVRISSSLELLTSSSTSSFEACFTFLPFTSNKRSPDLKPACLAGLCRSTERTNTGPLPRSVTPYPPAGSLRSLNCLTLEMTTRLGGTLADPRAFSTTCSTREGDELAGQLEPERDLL